MFLLDLNEASYDKLFLDNDGRWFNPQTAPLFAMVRAPRVVIPG